MSDVKNLRFEVEGAEDTVKEILEAVGKDYYFKTLEKQYPSEQSGSLPKVEEKPEETKKKSTRRTKAQIEADKAAEEALEEAKQVKQAEDLGPELPDDPTSQVPDFVSEEPVQPSEQQIAPETDLTPAKELQPMPASEHVTEISQDMVRSELGLYCSRLAPEHAKGLSEDEAKKKMQSYAFALCLKFGNSDTGSKGVAPELRQAVIEAAQSNWTPELEMDNNDL